MMRWLVLFIALLGFCGGLHATETEASGRSSSTVEGLKEDFAVTNGTASIGGKPIKYTATAGNLILKSSDGKPTASIFFVAYTKDGTKDLSKRPITFVTNGGPGSSAVWLHLGVFGPRRVYLNDDGTAYPPYKLVNNDYSILDLTDLVFIDPVSSGFSRAAPGVDPKQFHNTDEDVRCLGEFIRLYLSRYDRWESPKLFAGESYGTTRAAAIASHLHDEEHIYFNGLIMISTVLNFENILFDKGNDIPYVLVLPTYAATAWYHKRLPADLQRLELPKLLTEVENFATGTYANGLMKGDRLAGADREALVKQIARYTGLSTQFIDRANLRIKVSRFSKELLRDQDRTVGRFDSRYLGIDSDSCGDTYEYDPSADAVFGVFTAAINQYLAVDLGCRKDEKYDILANVWPWNFGDKSSNAYLNVSEQLRGAMTRNPKLLVFVGSGYYDLATPYFSATYTFDHLGIDPSLRGNVTLRDYVGGHMMYNYKPSMVKLKEDLTAYFNKAVP